MSSCFLQYLYIFLDTRTCSHRPHTQQIDHDNDVTEEYRDSLSLVRQLSGRDDSTHQDVTNMITVLNATCGNHNNNLLRFLNKPNIQPKIQFEDRLLVVEFNNPHYESIPFLESLYRVSFPNILYCTLTPIENATNDYELFTMKLEVGEIGNMEDWIVRNLLVEVTFKKPPNRVITYNVKYIIHDQGTKIPNYMSETPNFCIEAAIQRMPSFRGYFYMADDVVFHFWKTTNFDPDKFWWYNKNPQKFFDVKTEEQKWCVYNNGTISNCRPVYWTWFGRYKNEIRASLKAMARHSALSKQCLTELTKRTGGNFTVVGGSADFYYVPGTRALDFLHMSNLFRTTRLWHEISIHMMIYCLNKPEQLEVSKLYHNWNFKSDRRLPWLWYPGHLDDTSVHPLKLGPLAHVKLNDTQLFCKLLFPNAANYIYNGNLPLAKMEV